MILSFKLISKLEIGDLIKGTKFNKKVSGEIVRIHPGAVVIINDRNGKREVVDSDRIDKVTKKKDVQKIIKNP